jgi:hypothetical protein
MCLGQGVFRHLRLIAHSHVLVMRLRSVVGLTIVPKFGGDQIIRTLEILGMNSDRRYRCWKQTECVFDSFCAASSSRARFDGKPIH